ncbi:MAG: universal stress protein [Chloroflexaceae bacterium]|jgi:nucleotide-binding universal stress UspA family protein|nr:universal stress protein [Chloroflexaceae bacterium]
MNRTILVPLDGSSFGEHALPIALGIARTQGAVVELVHVCSPNERHAAARESAFFEHAPGVSARLDALAYLRDMATVLGETWEIPISAHVLQGTTVATLVTHIHHHPQINLVVMTTHGYGPLNRIWLGSVADALVRELRVPMVLVRPNAMRSDVLERVHERPFHHVLLPLDGSSRGEAIIPAALQVGQPMNARYTLLQAVPPLINGVMPSHDPQDGARLAQWRANARSYLNGVAGRMCNAGVDVATAVRYGLPHEVIISFARDHGVDLVAMTTHGHGGLARLLMGSVARQVITHSTLSVMLYRPALLEGQ